MGVGVGGAAVGHPLCVGVTGARRLRLRLRARQRRQQNGESKEAVFDFRPNHVMASTPGLGRESAMIARALERMRRGLKKQRGRH